MADINLRLVCIITLSAFIETVSGYGSAVISGPRRFPVDATKNNEASVF